MLQVVLLDVLREVVDLHRGYHGGEREHRGVVAHRRLRVERALRVHQKDYHLEIVEILVAAEYHQI